MKTYIGALCLVLILFSCKEKQVTFVDDIAPMVYRSCSPCHRPNQIGHFNLLTYEDVKLSSAQSLFTMQQRIMPPWPADPKYRHFVGENILTQNEINLFETWVKTGCALGDSSRIPAIPKFPEGSLLGVPDLRIPIKPIQLKDDYEDQFLLIKVPFEIPQDTFMRAVEFVPGNTEVVHHVNGDMVKFDFTKKKNVFDGDLVSPMKLDSTIKMAYQKIGILQDDGSYPTLSKSVVNYLPGVIAQQYPDGIGGWKLNRKNAFLLADLHYGPSAKNVWDSSYINIFFAKNPPARPFQEFQMGTLGVSPIIPDLIIPPGKISTYTTRYKLPRAISLVTINPHMHLLGKSFKAYALPPDGGDTIPLIHIPKWNFNWQNFYTFEKLLPLKAGTIIVVEGVFDNTANNPFNPYHPPREIRDNMGSMKTTDEMFQFIVTYLPYQQGDENVSLRR
ncbi:MAG: hypothetical protein JNM95_09675 [Chitinophagaceae bacterium]|nr:hypothetical protein [Chitinophagaceae bacterium]